MQSTSATSEHTAPRPKLAAISSADVVGYFRLMIDATLETLATKMANDAASDHRTAFRIML